MTAAQDWVAGYLRPELDLVTRRVVDRFPLDKALALPPAIDAVTALALGDLLDPGDAQTLLAPWAEVVKADEADERDDGGAS